MGVVFSRMRRTRKIVFLGLSNSGKSSIIKVVERTYNKTDTEEPVTTKGFKVSFLQRNNRNFSIWELGGEENIVQFWKCYLTNVNGVVFVIDGSDEDNKHKSISLMYEISREKSLENSVILILVHKSGKEVNISELNKNGVHLFGRRKFKAFETSVERPDTIISAFEWFLNTVG